MRSPCSAPRSWAIVALPLLVACARHPAATSGKVVPAPAQAKPAPAPTPPPSFYACSANGAPVAGDDAERICVPYGGTPRGEAQALVTVVLFTDYQCPYCGKVEKTLGELRERYGTRLRIYVRHNPLPFHSDAKLAAQAAVAAERQGQLWAMHDMLFQHQDALAREDLLQYAQVVGLEAERFATDLESAETQARVEQDLELASALKVQGTPNFFVNGRALRGALPLDRFVEVIDDELVRANRLGGKAATGHAFYTALMRGEGKGLGKPVTPTPPPPIPLGTEVLKIDLGDAPQKGATEPTLTLIVFSDFECPYCARMKATLEALHKQYPGDLRVAFRHFPLPFHNNAMAAALAAIAAGQQGKFWEMHDVLLANQRELGPADLQRHAQAIGLDLAKFQAALADPDNKARVEHDLDLGKRFGVGGTPSFFLNGRAFSGAYPLESFRALFDQELARVDAVLAGGTPRADLYSSLIREGLAKATPRPAPTRAGDPAPGEVYKAEIKGAPTRGGKKALVTMVEFSDFQCPFCARVQPTLERLLKEYQGDVRVAWRDLPLPFHDKAAPAAIAARAAGRQGKFWELHDLLFAHQQELDSASIAGHAEKLGLDMAKFRADLADESLARAVAADGAMAARLGARGTPSFFVNGTFLSGAQPYETFKERIDAELAKARALVKKGTPRAKVYDVIMKRAKDRVEKDDPSEAPAEGEKPRKVEVGRAPSRGPANAPVALVVFSDFECPFCGRLDASLVEVEQAFPGKIRVVWKNFPLSFHPHGKPAAEAALAAHEQGKFWAMHARLFAHQKELTDPELEHHAQEIGLDMARYKAAMASHKFAAAVEADMKQGNALGVEGTPATFVNGRLVSGAQPPEVFKAMVKKELARGKANKR
jgi:protein-disulfide isomerase